MAQPVITSFSQLASLTIQKYERYLPTAFDESLSILQKMNKIIERLDELGLITNSLIDQWKTVMDWVMGEGLDQAVSDKLDAMVLDGTLADLINEVIFDKINKKMPWVDVVVDYDADPTGVLDSSAAIQNAINYVKNLIISSNFKDNPMVVIPDGRYKINTQIVGSQLVKLKASGTVIFETYVSSNSAFFFAPNASDPLFTDIMNKQQWFRSPFLNGVDGGFIFVNKLDKDSSNSTAIEIGARVDITGERPFSRYSVTDVAIENYNIGLKMNRWDNYISSFSRFHIENNNICVQFGEASQNVVNSGENIHFSDSVFASGTTAFEWLSDGFDLRLVNCSIDFVQRAFYMKRGWKNIVVLGGHIENIGERFSDGVVKGGICVFDVDNVNDSPVLISIHGASALLKKVMPMFRSSVDGKLRVHLSPLHYRSVDISTDISKAWLGEETVVFDKFSLLNQGQSILPNRRSNEFNNFNLMDDLVTTTDDMTTDVAPKGFDVTREYSVYNRISGLQAFESGKSIEFLSNNQLGYLKLITTDYRPINASETVIGNCAIKMSDISQGFIKIRFHFYDHNKILLESTDLSLATDGFTNNVWNYATRPKSAVAPAGAAYYKAEYLLTYCNGTPAYISGFYHKVLR